MNSYLSNSLRGLVLIGQLVCSSMAFCASPAAVDDKEMQQLEAELAEFNKMYENMSEKEKAEFNSMMQDAVEEVRKGLSDEGKQLFEKLEGGNISDEEIDKLLNELVPSPETAKPAAPVEEPVKEAVVEKPAQKTQPKQVITSKHQKAIDIIRSLITLTNSFIVKAGSLPEFPGDLKNWEKEGSITWKKGQTWNTFKHELEKFVSLLNKLIERDKKTGDYLHLDELLKNESVYNNLSKLEKTISSLEAKIEEISPLTKKISPDSKAALQKTISQYHEALFTLQLPQDIAQLLEKFEPKAKTMRESQEAAQKKAAEESKRPRIPGSPVVGGRADAEGGYYSPSSYSGGYSGGYSNGSNTSPSYEAYIPETLGALDTSPAEGKSAKGSQMGGSPRSGGNAETQSEEVDGKSDDAKQADAKGATRSPQMKMEENSDAKKLREKIENNIDDVAQAIASSKKLTNISTLAMNNEPIDSELANVVLPEMLNHLTSKRKGILGNLDALKIKINSGKLNRSFYKNSLEQSIKKHEKILAPFMTQVDALEKEWGTISAQVPAVNRFAYFGGEKPKDVFTSEQGKEIEKRANEIATENIPDEQKGQKLIAVLGKEMGLSQEQVLEQVSIMQNQEAISKIQQPASLFEINKALRKMIETVRAL